MLVMSNTFTAPDEQTIRSCNHRAFIKKLCEALGNGWRIRSMDTRYRQTKFGGFSSYCAVLGRA